MLGEFYMQKSLTVDAVKDPGYGSSGVCLVAAGGGRTLPVSALRFHAHEGKVLCLHQLHRQQRKPAA